MSEGVWENRGPWRRVNSLLHLGVVVQGMSVSIDGAGVVAVGRGLGPSFSRRKAGAQCVVSNRGGERM